MSEFPSSKEQLNAQVSSTLPLVLVSLPALLFFLMIPFWNSTNKLPVKGRLVVITGGSQGLGLSVAKILAKKGAHIAIIARDQRKLDKAIDEISKEALDPATQKFIAISADLTTHANVKRAFDSIVEWHGVPDIVWGVAGSAQLGMITDVTPEHLDSQMQINYMSSLYVAHVAINLMVDNPLPSSAPRRHLIFTSSIISFVPIAGYAPYAPAKAAMRSLTDSLRQECILYDIDVHCCFPATIFTPGYENEEKTKPALTKKLEERDGGQTPEEVARICVRCLEKGQTLVTTTWIGNVLKALSWSGSKRNNYLVDMMWTWAVPLIWWIFQWEMDSQVLDWKKKKPFVRQRQ